MPERWEREVGKLGTLTAPASVPQRISEGPHGDGMPPRPRRSQQIIVAAVAFALFGVAAAFLAGAFQHGGPTAGATPETGPSVIIHLGSESGPKASLEFGDQVADPQVGSHCWTTGRTQGCVDTYLSPFPAKDFVDVPAGTPLVIDASGDPTDVTTVLSSGDNPQDRIEQTGPVSPASVIDGEAGRAYLLTVTADWPQGSVQFFFPIRIVAAETGKVGPTPSPEPTVVGTSPGTGETVTVPDVVGLTVSDALGVLHDVGLDGVGAWTPGSGTAAVERDIVVSQEPAAGTLVDTDTPIRLDAAAA